MKKNMRDLEDVRNTSDDVRAFRNVGGSIRSDEDFSTHPEGCSCGHCGQDHSHDASSRVPRHTHGDGSHEHTHEHAHEHEGECCCGHDHGHAHEHTHEHEDECGCGHDHAHEHTHEHVHGHHVPGHPDDCQCEICHPHEEYCDICGESLANCTCRMPDADKVKRVYILKNLGCANCAAKMEYKIKELPGVTYANISFVTKQLRLSAADHEAILPAIREICASIESDVEVVPRDVRPAASQEGAHIYMVENLDCANCGAKIERALNRMPEIKEAVLTFTTKKLKVSAVSYDGLLEKMQAVADSVEDGVVLVEADEMPTLAPSLEQRKKAGGILRVLSEKESLLEIVIGGLIFIVTEWMGLVPEEYHLYCLVAAYILLGGRIVMAALKNITKGHVFDENFLMTVATLGAFAIRPGKKP